METEVLKQKTEELTNHLGDYAETYLNVALLNAAQKGSNMASAAVSSILLGGLALFVLLFAGIGLGWWIGNLVNSRAGGFFIIAGLYLLLFVIGIMMTKKTIFPYLRNLIIRKVYE